MLVTQQSKPVLCLKVNKNDHARMQLTGICVMSYDDMYFFLIYLGFLSFTPARLAANVLELQCNTKLVVKCEVTVFQLKKF